MMKRFWLSFLTCLLVSSPTLASEKYDADYLARLFNTKSQDTVFDCAKKTAPEGVAANSPLQPDPYDCIGAVADPCIEAGETRAVCIARETEAWTEAVEYHRMILEIYQSEEEKTALLNASSNMLKSAISVCSVSPAAYKFSADEAGKGKTPLPIDPSHPCVMNLVAQQSIIILAPLRWK